MLDIMNRSIKSKLSQRRHRVTIKIKILKNQIKFNELLIKFMRNGNFEDRDVVDVLVNVDE